MMTMVIMVRTVITMMFDDNGVNNGDDNQVFYLAPVPSCAPTDDDVDNDWADQQYFLSGPRAITRPHRQ